MKIHLPEGSFLTLVVSLIALRLFSSNWLNLGIDEVYYWAYSLDLKWSYFDHPPMVAWSIFMTTLGDQLHGEFFVRLTATLAWLLASLALYRIALERWGQQAAFIALGLMSLSIYNSIIAGLMILPDAPLMIFTSGFLYAFHRLEKGDEETQWWLLLGLCLGAAYWSKYQSFLWAPMLVFWILLFRKQWLKNPKLYLAAVINLLLLIPVLYFNFFSSTEQAGYHGSRFAFDGVHPLGFLQALVGEMLYMHPVIFGLLVWAFIKRKNIQAFHWFMLMASLPLIGVGWSIALFESTLPHWTGPAYLFLFVFIMSQLEFIRVKKLLFWTMVVQLFLMVIALGEVSNGWFSNRQAIGKNPYEMGRLDGTLDVYGWDQLKSGLRSYDIERLVINHWYPGSHLSYYVGVDNGYDIIPYGEADMLHELVHHPHHSEEDIPLPAHFIESSRFPRQGKGILEDDYDLVEIGRVPVIRSGDTVMIFFVNEVVTCDRSGSESSTHPVGE